MPTFTAIALDTLLEPGASKSVDKSIPRPVPKPGGPNSWLERRNSSSITERQPKAKRPPLTPSLYATPEATPLPDSPTSFPPSPYIVNHKRRGPRLLKSSSASNVVSQKNALPEEKESLNLVEKDDCVDVAQKTVESIKEHCVKGSCDSVSSSGVARDCNGMVGSGNFSLRKNAEEVENGSSSLSNGWASLPKQVLLTPERNSEREDFYDPRESMSFTSSTDVEDNTDGERSAQLATSSVEFYDAWEELSSESGQQQSSLRDIESELREMRLSFVMEIEKRKQAEEALTNAQNRWLNLRQQLSRVGLTLPENLTMSADGEVEEEAGEELCRQIHLARFVANTIGRGLARAELEAEMEKQIEAKNFEIARLCDKLRNYEAMNQEMVQRNRDVLEIARRERTRKERRQRWIWGSLAAALTLGASGLAWSYLPSLPSRDSEASRSDDGAN